MNLKIRNNKLINFILEISQVMLVFLGVYSALMCMATSLELTFNRGIFFLIMLIAAVLFYGLFTVLETFHNGKLYGLLGLLLFYIALWLRFHSALQQGMVTMVNSFLKQFMNYSGTTLTLWNYNASLEETGSVLFCTTFVLILVGVLQVALVSAFFYRKRRSVVFIIVTVPFMLMPLLIGKMGYFSNVFTYLVVSVSIVGTRHLRTDATDRRMRQKLSLVLMVVCLVEGLIAYAYMPPERYERGKDRILQVKNSALALTRWSNEDVMTWFKANFNEDALSYGKLGDKGSITYSGSTILRLKGAMNKESNLYFKGYVGDVYQNNKWSSLNKDSEYSQELETMDQEGISPDKWQIQMRNEVGTSETSGETSIFNHDKLTISNLGAGYGNYLVPYIPVNGLKTETNGRQTAEDKGIEYTVDYYMYYLTYLRSDYWSGSHNFATNQFWYNTQAKRNKMTEFTKKYYLQMPDNLSGVINKFKEDTKKEKGYKFLTSGETSDRDKVEWVRNYLQTQTSYTLNPGKTPSDMDTVEYFMNQSKKGYCTYYATTATLLLRSLGVPARYVEGVCIKQDDLVNRDRITADGSLNVLDSDAHAWVEVYDDKYGFLPVEVTPGYGDSLDTDGNDYVSKDDADNTDNQDNQSDDVKTDNSNKNDQKPEEATPTPAVTEVPEEDMIFEDIDQKDTSKEGGLGNTSRRSTVLFIIFQVVLILVLVAAAMEAQRRIRLYLFKKRERDLKGRRRIRMMYHHIVPLLLARKVIYRRQSVEEYTRQIAEAMAMEPEEIRLFVEMVFHARFGPDDIGKEEMEQFMKEFLAIRDKAFRDSKFITKLYYMYILAL